jgi:hypothetical protein
MDIIKEPDCIKFPGPPKLTDRDTVVTLSIDNSGSMRGRPIHRGGEERGSRRQHRVRRRRAA